MKPEPIAASPRSGLLSPGAQMAGPRTTQRPLSAGLSPGGGGGGGAPGPVHSAAGNNGGAAFSFSGPVSSLASSMGNTITLNASAGVSTLTVPSSDAYSDSDIFSELFSGGPLDGFGAGGGGGGGSAGGAGGVTFSSGSGTLSTVSAPPMSRAPPASGHMYVNTSAAMGGSRPSSRQSHNSTPTPHPASLPSFSPAGGFQISPPASAEYGRPSPAADSDDGPLKGLLGQRSVSSDTLGDSKEGLLQVSGPGPRQGGGTGRWEASWVGCDWTGGSRRAAFDVAAE